MADLSPAAAILTAWVEEWAASPENAKPALAAAIRKALAAAPYRFCSGRRFIDYGVISSICSELEGPLNPELWNDS